MKSCNNCGGTFPNRIVIDGCLKILSSRKYCLTCSPFGSHRTKPIVPDNHRAKTKWCHRCQSIKSIDEFYKRRKGNNPSSYCKVCTNNQTTERTKETKRLCVEYKGGKCVCCDYDLCIDALDFHHLDRDEKQFCISSVKSKSIEKLKPELDKCVLVCCRCHREIEAGIRNCPSLPTADSSLPICQAGSVGHRFS